MSVDSYVEQEANSSSTHGETAVLPLSLAQRRQITYRLFSSIFQYPNEGPLETLAEAAEEIRLNPGLLADLQPSDLGPYLALLDSLIELPKAPSDPIEEAFVSLFRVKPKAPPYESTYIDPEGFNRGWINVQLEHEYVESGMALVDTFKEPPDHIAIELEFMAYLCRLESQTDVLEEQQGILAKQRSFLGRHLARWVPLFNERLFAAAPESHYALAGEVMAAFLRREISHLSVGDAGLKQSIPDRLGEAAER